MLPSLSETYCTGLAAAALAERLGATAAGGGGGGRAAATGRSTPFRPGVVSPPWAPRLLKGVGAPCVRECTSVMREPRQAVAQVFTKPVREGTSHTANRNRKGGPRALP